MSTQTRGLPTPKLSFDYKIVAHLTLGRASSACPFISCKLPILINLLRVISSSKEFFLWWDIKNLSFTKSQNQVCDLSWKTMGFARVQVSIWHEQFQLDCQGIPIGCVLWLDTHHKEWWPSLCITTREVVLDHLIWNSALPNTLHSFFPYFFFICPITSSALLLYMCFLAINLSSTFRCTKKVKFQERKGLCLVHCNILST